MLVIREGKTPDVDFMEDGMVRGFEGDNQKTREFRTIQELSALGEEAGFNTAQKWQVVFDWKDGGIFPW